MGEAFGGAEMSENVRGGMASATDRLDWNLVDEKFEELCAELKACQRGHLTGSNSGGKGGLGNIKPVEPETVKERLEEQLGALLELVQMESLNAIIRGEFELATALALRTVKFAQTLYGCHALECVPYYLLLSEAHQYVENFTSADEFLSLAQYVLAKERKTRGEQGQILDEDESQMAADLDEQDEQRKQRGLVTSVKGTGADEASENWYRLQAMVHERSGLLLTARGVYDQAIDQLSQATYWSSRAFGFDHIETSRRYFYLGNVWENRDRPDMARQFYGHVIQCWKDFLVEFVEHLNEVDPNRLQEANLELGADIRTAEIDNFFAHILEMSTADEPAEEEESADAMADRISGDPLVIDTNFVYGLWSHFMRDVENAHRCLQIAFYSLQAIGDNERCDFIRSLIKV